MNRVVRFNKIRLVHVTSLSAENFAKLARFSVAKPEILENQPSSDTDFLRFVGDADALMVSTRVAVPAAVIDGAKQLKYIGVYGTYTGLIDEKAGRKRGITITNVEHYCDEETAQFTLDELQKIKVKKTLGIIGMGRIGRALTKLAVGKGFTVLYKGRSRQLELEGDRVTFVDLKTLLTRAEVISLQVPVGCMVLGHKEFALIPPGKVLVNTARDRVMDPDALNLWLEERANTLIVDQVGAMPYPHIHGKPNVIISPHAAWRSDEAIRKLGDQFINNIETFLRAQRPHTT